VSARGACAAADELRIVAMPAAVAVAASNVVINNRRRNMLVCSR
jgi:hypothetical protein